MPAFIVRAHAAPTRAARFLSAVGTGAHVEYLARIILHALFISKGHRADTDLTLVLENSTDYSRAITLSGASMGDLGGLTESAVIELLGSCLSAAEGLGKEASLTTAAGVVVQAISFERLLKARQATAQLLLLDPDGTDIRSVALPVNPVFILTDHVPMPPKLRKSLLRQGVAPVSLGPVMLHASQCVVIVQNEYDRQRQLDFRD